MLQKPSLLISSDDGAEHTNGDCRCKPPIPYEAKTAKHANLGEESEREQYKRDGRTTQYPRNTFGLTVPAKQRLVL